ncbi:MAG TPA: AAA family ATPase [Thermoanaerobaculia bacterium]|nr:AAA family ATPase [Thermoanaerobaculia bacterium]
MVTRFFRPPEGDYFLFGPRGTGKSTWLRAAYQGALWLDLLAPDVERRLVSRPERLRELVAGSDSEIVVIDEVQRAPGLLTVVHQLIEERSGKRFVLTGSSARKLKRTEVDLLAGRAVVRSLHPFMAAELGDRFDLERALVSGLLPVVWEAPNPQDTLAAYTSLYVREEVRGEALVRDLGAFQRFLEAISFSQAAPLNLSEVARECQVSRKTVDGYLAILEDLLLAFRVPVFTRRARRHLVAHPKLFLADLGVFRSLRPAGPLDRPEEIAGAALEGLVAQHLRAWIDYSRLDAELAYWRTRAGSEVDLIVYGANVFCAIEIKHAAELRRADLRPLLAFREDYPEAQLRLLYRGVDKLEMEGIQCLPVDPFLRKLSPGQPLP